MTTQDTTDATAQTPAKKQGIQGWIVELIIELVFIIGVSIRFALSLEHLTVFDITAAIAAYVVLMFMIFHQGRMMIKRGESTTAQDRANQQTPSQSRKST